VSLAWWERLFLPLLVAGMAAGLMDPRPGQAASPLLLPLFALLMGLLSTTLPPEEVREALRQWRAVALMGTFSLLPWSLFFALAGQAVGLSPMWAAGFVLASSLPSDLAAPLLTALARGSTSLATVGNAFLTAASPLVLPSWVEALTHAHRHVPLLPLMGDMLSTVLVPAALGVGLRAHFPVWERYAQGTLAVCLALYALLAWMVMSKAQPYFVRVASPTQWVALGGWALAVNVGGYGLGALAWLSARGESQALPAFLMVTSTREFTLAAALVQAGGFSPALLPPSLTVALVQGVTGGLLATFWPRLQEGRARCKGMGRA
jgi:BASS family bile acid:Na+ symporter